MKYRLVYPDGYVRSAKILLKKHPDLRKQYQKTLQLLELNPWHPSLRLHSLQGSHNELSSVSINMSYRIVLELIIQDHDIILVDSGDRDHVY